jgi:hypothetical protein
MQTNKKPTTPRPKPSKPQTRKTLYIVGALIQERKLQIGNNTIDIKMDWAAGMIGALPVFEKREDAEKNAGDTYPIFEVHV